MVTSRDRKSFESHRKKFRILLIRLAPLTFLIRAQALGRELPHVQIYMNDNTTRSREMASYSAIDFPGIRLSSKIYSITSGLVTVFGRPGRGASQVEKSPRLNWATLSYDGACSPCFYQNGVNFLRRLVLQEKKLDYSSCHNVVEIVRVA